MAWKIYAWGMLMLVAITLVGRLWMRVRRSGSAGNWDLFEAAFNVVLLPGLFGFAYHRAYLHRTFWEVTVPLAWVAIGYGIFSPTHRKLAREKGVEVALAASLASFALNFPGMLAITLYAYRRPEIWR
jgi:hypothetical protein